MVKNLDIEKKLKDLEKRIKKLEENPFLNPSNLKIDYLNNNEKDVKFEEAVKIIKGQKRVTA